MPRTLLFRKMLLALQTARREHLESEQLPPPVAKTEHWSRRKFVGTTALAGTLALTEGCWSLAALAAAKTARVAIIGGGLAGLNAAYQLKQAGVKATVYEARNRVGGRVQSLVIDGNFVVDLGAELINTDHADMLGLVKDFGIKLFNKLDDAKSTPAPEEAFYFEGLSRSEAELAADFRQIVAQINKDATLLDQNWDTYAPPLDKLSVADYLLRHSDKIKKPYVRALLTSMIHSEYGVEPHESSALQLISLLPVVDGNSVDLLSYGDEVFSVIGGSAKITDGLARELSGQIKLGTAVTGIKANGAGFSLTFAKHAPVEADYVIIAIPFPVLRGIGLEVALPARLRRFISESGLGSNEKVIASFSRRFWRQANGFSLAAWGVPGVSEIWDETQRQNLRKAGALNFFLGGDLAREAANKPLKALGKQFVAALDALLPGASKNATGQFVGSGWTKSQFTLGSYANYKPGQLTRFGGFFWLESDNPDERQEVSHGNLIFAGEHLSEGYYGFMNGAAQTGRLAAQLLMKKLAAVSA